MDSNLCLTRAYPTDPPRVPAAGLVRRGRHRDVADLVIHNPLLLRGHAAAIFVVFVSVVGSDCGFGGLACCAAEAVVDLTS